MIKIRLIPWGRVEQSIAAYLQEQLPVKIGPRDVTVEINEVLALPDENLLKKNRQSLAAALLTAQSNIRNDDPRGYQIGIIERNLGENQEDRVFMALNVFNRTGVIALAPLRQEFYQLPPEEPVFRARLLKMALHMLGQFLGVPRCADPKCLMSYARNNREIDTKYPVYCLNCRPTLDNKLTKP